MTRRIACVLLAAIAFATSLPAMAAAKRISGNTAVPMPRATLVFLAKQRIPDVELTARLCVAPDGRVRSADVDRSSGFSDLDETVTRELRSWRYEPTTVDGHAVPYCLRVSFRYTID
jgi:TonB family protein